MQSFPVSGILRIPTKEKEKKCKQKFTKNIVFMSVFMWIAKFKLHLIFVDHNVLVACYASLHPALSVHLSVHQSVCLSVGPFVHPSVTLDFFGGLRPHCSCPNDQVTSKTAPAHPHMTGVAVYLALFSDICREWQKEESYKSRHEHCNDNGNFTFMPLHALEVVRITVCKNKQAHLGNSMRHLHDFRKGVADIHMDQRKDQRTDQQTDPLLEMRWRI